MDKQLDEISLVHFSTLKSVGKMLERICRFIVKFI